MARDIRTNGIGRSNASPVGPATVGDTRLIRMSIVGLELVSISIVNVHAVRPDVTSSLPLFVVSRDIAKNASSKLVINTISAGQVTT